MTIVDEVLFRMKPISTEQEDKSKLIGTGIGASIRDCIVEAVQHIPRFSESVHCYSAHYSPQEHTPNLANLEKKHHYVVTYFYKK